MNECIFCKIIKQEIPSKKQYEDELCYAFDDIHPQARVHILVIPKRHIAMLADTVEDDKILLGHMMYVAKELAAKHNCTGFKVNIANGKEGGQEVFHIHMHMIGK